MKASQFILGELVEVENDNGVKVLAYVNNIYSISNKLELYFLKSNSKKIKVNRNYILSPIGFEYMVKPLRETHKNALYDLMDFALDIKDFEYAREIHKRLYPTRDDSIDALRYSTLQ